MIPLALTLTSAFALGALTRVAQSKTARLFRSMTIGEVVGYSTVFMLPFLLSLIALGIIGFLLGTYEPHYRRITLATYAAGFGLLLLGQRIISALRR